MLKVKPVTKNMTVVTVGDVDILFSYETAVAYARKNSKAYVSEDYIRFSRTTTRHINRWLDGRKPLIVPQSLIESKLRV